VDDRNPFVAATPTIGKREFRGAHHLLRVGGPRTAGHADDHLWHPGQAGRYSATHTIAVIRFHIEMIDVSANR
jgi:hypothetical protein